LLFWVYNLLFMNKLLICIVYFCLQLGLLLCQPPRLASGLQGSLGLGFSIQRGLFHICFLNMNLT
jgi:hypothetical protein